MVTGASHVRNRCCDWFYCLHESISIFPIVLLKHKGCKSALRDGYKGCKSALREGYEGCKSALRDGYEGCTDIKDVNQPCETVMKKRNLLTRFY